MNGLIVDQHKEDSFEASYDAWQGYGETEDEAREDLAKSMEKEANEILGHAKQIRKQ